MERVKPFPLKTPSSIIIVDPWGCCKTCFIESLLSRLRQELFANPPFIIVYYKGAWQDKFKSMK